MQVFEDVHPKPPPADPVNQADSKSRPPLRPFRSRTATDYYGPDYSPTEEQTVYGIASGSVFLISIVAIAIVFISLCIWGAIDCGLWPRCWRRRMKALANRADQSAQDRLQQRLARSIPSRLSRNNSHERAHEAATNISVTARNEYCVTVSGGSGYIYGTGSGSQMDMEAGTAGSTYQGWPGNVYAGSRTGGRGARQEEEDIEMVYHDYLRDTCVGTQADSSGSSSIFLGRAVEVQAPAPVKTCR